MKYKLFVTDYDGTLGNRSVIDGETLAAVKEYMARGGKFVVCTGRMFCSIRDILTGYGLKCPVISYQGAMIDDLSSGERLYSGGIDYKFAAEVTRTLKSENVDVAVDIGETRVYEKRSEFIEVYEKVVGIHGKQVKDMAEEILKDEKPVPKITVLARPERIKEITAKYSAVYGGRLLVNSGADALAEFVNPDCCKGKAVEWAAKRYGIPYSETIAVGDSTNDLQLVTGEWHGVAVGDAKDELKAAADEITVPFKDKPVKFLLEKYCLN